MFFGLVGVAMSQFTRFINIILLLVIAGMFTTACATGQSAKAIADEYRSSINDALPIGSSAEAVVDYLNEQSIEHDQYKEPAPQITGIARDVKKGFLTSTSLQFFFEFDQQKTLKRFFLKEIYTGP